MECCVLREEAKGLALGLTLHSACLELCMLQTLSPLQLQVQTAREIQTRFRDKERGRDLFPDQVLGFDSRLLTRLGAQSV